MKDLHDFGKFKHHGPIYLPKFTQYFRDIAGPGALTRSCHEPQHHPFSIAFSETAYIDKDHSHE